MTHEDFTTTIINKYGATNESIMTGGSSVTRLGDNILIHGHTVTGERLFCFRIQKEVLEVWVEESDSLPMFARQQAAHFGISHLWVLDCLVAMTQRGTG